jgi:hypothetical protein
VKAWLQYAVAGLVVTGLGVLVASALAGPETLGAVIFAAGLAYGVQLAAFALLVLVRDRGSMVLAGWVGGMVLRFLVVGVVAVWLSRSPVMPVKPALLSLVAFRVRAADA